MSPVAEKIRTHLKPELKPKGGNNFWALLWRGLRLNLGNLVREVGLTLLLLIFSFVPPFGLITTPLLFLIQAYFVGVGNMDYSLEAFFNYRQSKSFLNQYRGLAVGNGIIFNLLALIPFVGVIIVLPLSVSAAAVGVLKHTDLRK
jgi:CysZ protein